MQAAQAAAAEYDARIRRAEYLASAHPFAAEVLRFYSRLVEFQKIFSAEIKGDVGTGLSSRKLGSDRASSLPFDSINVLPRLTTFLVLLAETAPPTLAAAARQISRLDAGSQRALLSAYWELGGSERLLGPFAVFVPRAFIQPITELFASRITAAPALSTQHACPLCGGLPLLGVLRPEGDGGKRRMLCSFFSQDLLPKLRRGRRKEIACVCRGPVSAYSRGSLRHLQDIRSDHRFDQGRKRGSGRGRLGRNPALAVGAGTRLYPNATESFGNLAREKIRVLGLRRVCLRNSLSVGRCGRGKTRCLQMQISIDVRGNLGVLGHGDILAAHQRNTQAAFLIAWLVRAKGAQGNLFVVGQQHRRDAHIKLASFTQALLGLRFRDRADRRRSLGNN